MNPKMNSFKKVFIVLFILPVFIGCIKDKQKIKYTANVPIYMDYASIAALPINSVEGQPMINPGKIYFKDNYIFVNELGKGVHIFDNSNPSSPQNISFINIPGNVDISIKGNILYADNYIDLLAIDMGQIVSAKLVKRISKIFPASYPPTENDYPLAQIDNNKGVVIGWKLEEVTEVVENDRNFSNGTVFTNENSGTMGFDNSGSGEGLSNKTYGMGGSMARFSAYENYLYTIDNSDLNVFDITSPANPVSLSKINIGRDIETIFPYQDNLFIGSQTGMFIYSLASPTNPTYISAFAHVRSCDPVVVAGDYAYVTLRSGRVCGGTLSQLDVIDISNISSPWLKKSYPMQEPYGLGIDSNLLFICDGNAGLKAYNISDPLAIDQNMIAHYTGINTFDVIPHKNILMLIGKTGLQQYDYSDPTQLTLLSTIPIGLQ